MLRLINPVPIFLDARGALLDAGKIYIGASGQDPQANPVTVFWDADLTEEAAQPLRTLGGVIVNGETPSFVWIDEDDFSIRVLDADDITLPAYNLASVAGLISVGGGGGGGGDFQPLDADLTAIAALATTAYGRNLLIIPNQAALQAAVGITQGLPTTGGNVTGPITRTGAGVHPFFAASAMTGGRFYGPDPMGTADATSQPGDMQFFY